MRTMPVLSSYVCTYKEQGNQDRDVPLKNLENYTPFLYASSLGKDGKVEKNQEENSAQVLACPKGDVNLSPKNWHARLNTKLP